MKSRLPKTVAKLAAHHRIQTTVHREAAQAKLAARMREFVDDHLGAGRRLSLREVAAALGVYRNNGDVRLAWVKCQETPD